jgi:hypothetical protein
MSKLIYITNTSLDGRALARLSRRELLNVGYGVSEFASFSVM